MLVHFFFGDNILEYKQENVLIGDLYLFVEYNVALLWLQMKEAGGQEDLKVKKV